MVFEPIFIPVGEAQRLLNIRSRRTMQDLLARRILPHLRLGSHRTRLLPRSYILSLSEYLDGQSANTPLVRGFNATEQARRLTADATSRLLTAITSRNKHTSDEVAEIFGVERNTINNWILDGTLQAEIEPRRGMVISDNPLSQKYAIAATTLRSFGKWVTPL